MNRILILLLLIITLGAGGWYFSNKFNLFNQNQTNNNTAIATPVAENKTPELQEVEDLGLFIQGKVLYDENENNEEKVANPKIIKAKYRYFKLGPVTSGKYKDYQTYLVETNNSILSGFQASGKVFYYIAVNNGKMVVYFDTSVSKLEDYTKTEVEDRAVKGKILSFEKFDLPIKFPEVLTTGNILILELYQGFFGLDQVNIFGVFQDFTSNQNFKKISTINGIDIYENTIKFEESDTQATYYLANINGILVNYYSSLKGFNRSTYANEKGDNAIEAKFLKLDSKEVAYSKFNYVEQPCSLSGTPYDFEKQFNFKVIGNSNLERVSSDSELEVYKFKDLNNTETKKLLTEVLKPFYFYLKDRDPNTRDPKISDLEKGGLLIYKDIFGIYRALIRKELLTGGCGKPVIYLYPEKDTKVSVSFVNPINFSTVIPNYKDSWEVIAHPNGILNDLKPQITNCNSFENIHGSEYAKSACTKNEYPYLYWSGKTVSINYPQAKSGFIVNKNNLNSFFDEKLGVMGFNHKETNDFKEYWVSYLTNKDSNYFRITFFQNEILNQMFPMKVSPMPKSTIRMFMDWESVDQDTQIIEQNLISYPRDGFTLVEWGGLKK